MSVCGALKAPCGSENSRDVAIHHYASVPGSNVHDMFKEPKPIQINLSGIVPPRQQPVKLQGAKFKTTEFS